MLWVCAHLPQMGLEMLYRDNPVARYKPTVLVKDHQIVLLNRPAAKAGIVLQSSLATAASLAPQLIHYSQDAVREQEYLTKLIPLVYRLTPRVSLYPPGDLMLEVAGSCKLFGGLAALLQNLMRSLRQAGHRCKLGIAHTPAAARVFARAGGPIPDAIDLTKNHLQAYTEQGLQNLSLKYAELQPVDIERLANMGIRVFGELLELPRHELRQRFHAELINYLARLTGERPEPQQYVEPPSTFTTELHMVEPVRDKASLHQFMQQPITELVHWLEARHLGVVAMQWKFSPCNEAGTIVPCQFAHPRMTEAALIEYSKITLEEAELPLEVMSLSLTVTRVDSIDQAGPIAKDLLGSYETKTVLPSALLDRLTARLGRDSWQLLYSIDDHRPEYSWCTNRLSKPVNKTIQRLSSSLPGSRPLWLLETPLHVQQKYFAILNGPLRIQSGWWDTPCIRDYFVGWHENGSLCWLFNDGRNWFQHGYFS